MQNNTKVITWHDVGLEPGKKISLVALKDLLIDNNHNIESRVKFESSVLEVLKSKAKTEPWPSKLQLYFNAFLQETCFYDENKSAGLTFGASDHQILAVGPGLNIPDFKGKEPEFGYTITIDLKFGDKPEPDFSKSHGADYVIYYNFRTKLWQTYI